MSTRMDDFTMSFLAAALWTETDQSREDGGDPLSDNYGLDDISPETVAQAIDDCGQFRRENAELLDRYCAARVTNPSQGTPEDYAGYDFLLTRNGHGTGFWDRELGDNGELGKALSDACKPYGEFNLYVGDDGLLYTF